MKIIVFKSGVKCFINLMTWVSVAPPDMSSAQPSLPIAGGVQTLTIGHSVFSVCLHPSTLQNSDESSISQDELNNIINLVFKFLEQQHPGLHINSEEYRLKII